MGRNGEHQGRVQRADLEGNNVETPFAANIPKGVALPITFCRDTSDNDGDGFPDLADPGCDDASDSSELGAIKCDDGLDNDFDNLIDLEDPNCSGPFDQTEGPRRRCGLGFELTLLLAPLLAMNRTRRRL